MSSGLACANARRHGVLLHQIPGGVLAVCGKSEARAGCVCVCVEVRHLSQETTKKRRAADAGVARAPPSKASPTVHVPKGFADQLIAHSDQRDLMNSAPIAIGGEASGQPRRPSACRWCERESCGCFRGVPQGGGHASRPLARQVPNRLNRAGRTRWRCHRSGSGRGREGSGERVEKGVERGRKREWIEGGKGSEERDEGRRETRERKRRETKGREGGCVACETSDSVASHLSPVSFA